MGVRRHGVPTPTCVLPPALSSSCEGVRDVCERAADVRGPWRGGGLLRVTHRARGWEYGRCTGRRGAKVIRRPAKSNGACPRPRGGYPASAEQSSYLIAPPSGCDAGHPFNMRIVPSITEAHAETCKSRGETRGHPGRFNQSPLKPSPSPALDQEPSVQLENSFSTNPEMIIFWICVVPVRWECQRQFGSF